MAKAMRIRTDDTVLVTSGKDKGKTGKVIRVDPKRRKVFVEGAQHRQAAPASALDGRRGDAKWHHREGRSDRRLQRRPARPDRQQADPVGMRVADDGKRTRFSKRTDKAID